MGLAWGRLAVPRAAVARTPPPSLGTRASCGHRGGFPGVALRRELSDEPEAARAHRVDMSERVGMTAGQVQGAEAAHRLAREAAASWDGPRPEARVNEAHEFRRDEVFPLSKCRRVT